MRQHRLKCWPQLFEPLQAETKTFELRFNDRAFKVGDELLIEEFVPVTPEKQGHYTGRSVRRQILYILPANETAFDIDSRGLREGWVILALGAMPWPCVLSWTPATSSSSSSCLLSALES